MKEFVLIKSQVFDNKLSVLRKISVLEMIDECQVYCAFQYFVHLPEVL